MRRPLAAAATIAAGLSLPLLLAAPALADSLDDGEVHGSSLGAGLTLLLYVLIPLGAFAVIAGLALLPSALRRDRYRPGRAWAHDAMWFGGPDQPADAVAAARPGSLTTGGADASW